MGVLPGPVMIAAFISSSWTLLPVYYTAPLSLYTIARRKYCRWFVRRAPGGVGAPWPMTAPLRLGFSRRFEGSVRWSRASASRFGFGSAGVPPAIFCTPAAAQNCRRDAGATQPAPRNGICTKSEFRLRLTQEMRVRRAESWDPHGRLFAGVALLGGLSNLARDRRSTANRGEVRWRPAWGLRLLVFPKPSMGRSFLDRQCSIAPGAPALSPPGSESPEWT